MELITLLTGQPAAVALAILAMYWLNRNTLEFAREKREIIEIVRAERKEWLDEARAVRDKLLDMQRSSIEADKEVDNEIHNLRGAIATVSLNVEQLLERVRGEAPRGVKGGDPNEPLQ